LNDPAAGWQTATSLPTARNHMGSVVLNGKIYVIAGQQHQDPNFTTVGTVEIYDPTTGKWTEGAPLPVTRSHIAGATFVYNGQIIVMGGDHTYLHDVDNVSSYNPVTNVWTDLTPLPIPRSSGCGNVINGVFYYATGNIAKYVYKGLLSY
jgi:N-acetylneuraminic acid mutarotase